MGCSCMILAVVCASQGVYASYSSTVEVVNHVETGDVNIDLTEYEILNGAETTYDPVSYREIQFPKYLESVIWQKTVMCAVKLIT